jgi:8-oxo-dGTP pyrophosphatase MutT (NUDIX family)
MNEPLPGRRSAGVIVLRRVGDDWRVLLLRAFRNWDFPKGLVEPGESPLQAAIRETAEETGLAGLDFRWGEDFRDTAPYANGKVARYFMAESPAGEVRLPVSAELGRPEHHEFRWLSFGKAAQLVPPRLAPVLAWARHRLSGWSPPSG